jgi:2-polyprenyl-3-methyl-5-hydroxy-6-metoxy-1,4-benzoquinol methylase
VPDDWFVGFHRGLAARFWRGAAATMAEDDAQLVRELLGGRAGARVLDVPCGDGRLTIRLAAAGYVAIGVDVAVAELDRARLAAAEAGVEVRFVTGDLRALPDVGTVDAIVCCRMRGGWCSSR